MENRYKALCCQCKNVFYAAKSIAQEHLKILDAGAGSCPHCNAPLRLTFKPDTGTMDTSLIKEYVRSVDHENTRQ